MILEVGCGSGGSYAFRPRSTSWDTIYLDIEAPRRGIENYVVADAHSLPFRGGSFTRIYASHVIEHLEEPRRFLRECYRVLKLGGELHVYTPNFLSRNARSDPRHKHIYSIFSLARDVWRAGFRVGLPYVGIFANSIPRLARYYLSLALYLFSDEIYVVGYKVL